MGYINFIFIFWAFSWPRNPLLLNQFPFVHFLLSTYAISLMHWVGVAHSKPLPSPSPCFHTRDCHFLKQQNPFYLTLIEFYSFHIKTTSHSITIFLMYLIISCFKTCWPMVLAIHRYLYTLRIQTSDYIYWYFMSLYTLTPLSKRPWKCQSQYRKR